MYKLKNTSDFNLTNKGFRQRYDGSYILRFPVFYWKSIPTSYCEAVIYPEESNEILLSVKRANGSTHYLWTIQAYDQARSLLEKIDKKISNKMRKIGAKYYDD